jgi:multiple RNA-binding domain-containing protein 1
MTAPSKLKTWRDGEPIPEQSIENPDADSAVPSLAVVEPEIKKVALTKDKLPDPPPQSTPTKIDADDDVSEDIMSNVMPASDMDWMRSKTSRLLGLVEDDDNEDAGEWTVRQDSPALVKGGAAESKLAEAVEDTGVAQSLPAEEAEATSPADTENASADVVAIRKSGRLFLRNLAYTIKEEELRYHFSPFGALEEVSKHIFSILLCQRMSVQIGTTYVQ